MRRGLRYGTLLAIVGSAGMLIWLISASLSQEKRVQKSTYTLPTFTAWETGNIFHSNTLKHKKALLLFFDSSCSHCQYMVTEVEKQQQLLKTFEVLLLSTEPDSVLNLFRMRHRGNFRVLHIDPVETSQFGITNYPTIYSYNGQGVLVGKYIGEVRVDKIVQEISRNGP